ncbi:MAG: caspase family protein [Chitinophagales bacterium]
MKNLLATIILFPLLSLTLSVDAQVFYTQGVKAYNNEDYKDAIELFTKSINSDKEKGFIGLSYNYRGKSYQILKKNNKAIDDYHKAIELNPNNATAYFNRGQLRDSYVNDKKGALVDYTIAIKLDAKYEEAYFSRASLKSEMGDFKGALADYNTILKYFNPNDKIVKGHVKRLEGKGRIFASNQNKPSSSSFQNKGKTNTNSAPLVNYDNIKTGIANTETNTSRPQNTSTQTTTTRNPSTANTAKSQIKEDAKLNIFWLSPNVDEIPEKGLYAEDEMMNIKIKTFSSHPLAGKHFTIFINGKPAKSYKFDEMQLTGGPHYFTYTNTVKLEPELNRIEVKVSNDAGTQVSRELKVMYNPRKPDLHVLSIGPKATNLKYTQKDAENFADMFIGQAGPEENKVFANVYVKKLTGEAATTNEIRGMLEEYLYHQDVQPKDMMLLFIASHGFIDAGDFRIQGSDYNPIRRRSTSLSFKDDVSAHLNKINCKKLVFIDACHSGGARSDVMNINDAIKQLSQKQNICLTFTSSSQNQLSYEDDRWNNGAFTKALIDGMQRGKADVNGDKVVTIKELSDYVGVSVRDMVHSLKNELQEPSFINDEHKGVGDNLPIYIIENFTKVKGNQAATIENIEIKPEVIKKH